MPGSLNLPVSHPCPVLPLLLSPLPAAAVLRQIYVRQGLGVGQLRMKFGGLNKRRGAKPEHFAKSSGGLIRHIMKQFESVGFVEKHTGE
jgi:small subunit ribosomal protein S19e